MPAIGAALRQLALFARPLSGDNGRRGRGIHLKIRSSRRSIRIVRSYRPARGRRRIMSRVLRRRTMQPTAAPGAAPPGGRERALDSYFNQNSFCALLEPARRLRPERAKTTAAPGPVERVPDRMDCRAVFFARPGAPGYGGLFTLALRNFDFTLQESRSEPRTGSGAGGGLFRGALALREAAARFEDSGLFAEEARGSCEKEFGYFFRGNSFGSSSGGFFIRGG